MLNKNYLEWLSNETSMAWWHDSGDPAELEQGKAWGARGVTTNPVLTYRAINTNRKYWAEAIKNLKDEMM